MGTRPEPAYSHGKARAFVNKVVGQICREQRAHARQKAVTVFQQPAVSAQPSVPAFSNSCIDVRQPLSTANSFEQFSIDLGSAVFASAVNDLCF